MSEPGQQHVPANDTPVPMPGPAETAAPGLSPAVRQVLGLQRTAGNAAVVQYLQSAGALSASGDPQEREADEAAQAALRPGPPPSVSSAPAAAPSPLARELDEGLASLGSGEPLSGPVRAFMEPRFGTDFSDVRVHTGGDAGAASRALDAEAFTYGNDIYYGAGRTAARDALTAHELSHVVQQRRGGSVAARRIQRSLTGSFPVTAGVFEVDMQTRQGGVNTPPAYSGLDGYIRFVPNPDAPNSNRIVFIQIVKLTDPAGADVNPQTMPLAQAPRGNLGDPGLRTQDDPAAGVQGGYSTDVHHRPNLATPGTPQGTPLAPDYPFQPAAPGAPHVGQTQMTAQYGGGIGGAVGQTPGFKRSNDAADIRSSALYDTPGVVGAGNFNFDFESVARGEDTMTTYGSVRWGYQMRNGLLSHEYLHQVDDASATFHAALERHRDFYVHEPVTFYFDFDRAALNGTELAKIDEFLPYLTRNPSVRMSIEGFADVHGGPSAHNLDLSMHRAEAVEAALVGRGIDAGRIDGIVIGHGASASATPDAGTGDQGGDAAVGADQTREANRWANRRVVLTFEQTASTPVGGAGP